MAKEESLYLEIGRSIKDAEESQLFGKPCFKINGKAFICFFEKCMVFKLNGTDHKNALSLDGSELFDPSKKDRAMKEWVQVPFEYSKQWKKLAMSSFKYVEENT
jgi:hypothetical protein